MNLRYSQLLLELICMFKVFLRLVSTLSLLSVRQRDVRDSERRERLRETPGRQRRQGDVRETSETQRDVRDSERRERLRETPGRRQRDVRDSERLRETSERRQRDVRET
ncbi:hypothetical protein OYC64_007344 [Pagothenia borchgrevinki]|uniref:Uncharacterized protein n=1 Tax=Pagothenia borchgrevinki TaxID=8213 RepID=A0ABD2GSU0_PAGBO